MRYFLEIAYKGTAYKGWQIQPKANTVQNEINNALSTILSEAIKTTGCGRTDTGVHAKQFFLHFDTEKSITEKKLVYKLNRILPRDIAAKKILKCESENHSRFDATERTYEYLIHFKKDPFLNDYSYYCTYSKPDLDKMNKAAKLLMSYNDFFPLCKLDHDGKTTFCDIRHSNWIELSEDHILYKVKADRFLRSMVRMTVGVLLMIGLDKLTVDDFKYAMKAQQRFKYIIPIPPCGLYLTRVKYPFID